VSRGLLTEKQTKVDNELEGIMRRLTELIPTPILKDLIQWLESRPYGTYGIEVRAGIVKQRVLMPDRRTPGELEEMQNE